MITFLQQNIGDLDYPLKNKIVHQGIASNGYYYYESGNFINKRQRLTDLRSAPEFVNQHFLKTQNLYDIYTLQEVQHSYLDDNIEVLPGEEYIISTKRLITRTYDSPKIKSTLPIKISENFQINQKKYTIKYNQTGSANYVDLNENNPRKINHGCAVVYDSDKFSEIIRDNLPNFKTQNRTSGWVLLTDNETNNNYAIISIHANIISNIGEGKYQNPYRHLVSNWYTNNERQSAAHIKKKLTIYKDIIHDIQLLKKHYPTIKIILGGDFNLNILSPEIDPYQIELSDSHRFSILKKNPFRGLTRERHLHNQNTFLLKNITKFNLELTKLGLIIIPNIKPTNIEFPFPIDFIIMDNLINFNHFNIISYNNHHKSREKLTHLRNDFDHNGLLFTFN